MVFDWLKSLFAPAPPELDFQLTIDSSGVRLQRPNGNVESVTWDDLQTVTMVTTDEGPLLEDVFIVLHGTNGDCAVPSGAPESDDLLKRLQQLPGFDNEAVIQAMCSASNNEFLCWERSTG